MKNPKLWIWLGVSGLIFICVMVYGPSALATDKPAIIPPPPKPVVVTETKHEYSAALVGAVVAWWLTRRHAKRNRPEPVVIVPPAPEPLTCEPVVERVLEACGVSK